jgi:hypothetical protein
VEYNNAWWFNGFWLETGYDLRNSTRKAREFLDSPLASSSARMSRPAGPLGRIRANLDDLLVRLEIHSAGVGVAPGHPDQGKTR